MTWTLVDLHKGNVALHGMAKCIMKKSGWMLHGVVAWRAYTPYYHELMFLFNDALEVIKHLVPHPMPQPPLTG